MKKIEISVLESVTFEHKITVEVPAGTNLDSMLDKAEKSISFDDVALCLNNYGCKIVGMCKDESGSDYSVEIPEYDEVE